MKRFCFYGIFFLDIKQGSRLISHLAADSACSHQTIIFMLTDLLPASNQSIQQLSCFWTSLRARGGQTLFALSSQLWVFMKLALPRFLPSFQTRWSQTAGSKATGEGLADKQPDSFHLCPQKEKKYKDHSMVHQQGKAAIM